MKTTARSPYFPESYDGPYNPDPLYKKGGYELFAEMAEDDQLTAVMRFRELLIVGRGYQIECEDEQQKEFVEWAMDRANIKRQVQEMLSADVYGFSISEKVPTVVDSPFRENIIMRLKTRPPHAWEIHQDAFGDLTSYIYHGDRGDIPVDPAAVIHYVNNPQFDNLYGQSDFNLGVYRAWWAKKNIIKFWHIYLERFASPKPIGKYPEGTSDQDKADLQNALKNLSIQTSAVVPLGVELAFLEAGKDSAGIFENAIDKLNLMMGRALLVPDLSGMSGSETQGGSFALGKTQSDVMLQVLSAKQEAMARLINEHYIPHMLRLNFNSPADCKFSFNAITNDEAYERVTKFVDAVQRQAAKVDLQDENEIRRVLGFPPVDEKAREKAAEEALVKQQDGEEESAADEDADGEAADETRQYAAEEGLSKAWTEAEVEFKKGLSEAVMAAVHGLVADVRKKRIVEKKSLIGVQNLQIRNKVAIRAAARRGMMPMVKRGTEDAKAEIEVRTNAGEDIDPEDVIRALTTTMTDSLTEEILKAVRYEVIQGIRAGESVDNVIARIEKMLENYDVSVPQQGPKGTITAPKLETLVRTNIATAYNEGKMRYFEKNGDIIYGYVYNAIMDGRQTPICTRLNGKVIRKSQARRFMPPKHYNCRSLLTAITIYEDDKPTFDDMEGLDGTGF